MRTFQLLTTDDETVLDTIVVDETDVVFANGAAEPVLDDLVDWSQLPGEDDIASAIDDWDNGLLEIVEVENPGADQVADLSGAARTIFNRLHPRRDDGRFRDKDGDGGEGEAKPDQYPGTGKKSRKVSASEAARREEQQAFNDRVGVTDLNRRRAERGPGLPQDIVDDANRQAAAQQRAAHARMDVARLNRVAEERPELFEAELARKVRMSMATDRLSADRVKAIAEGLGVKGRTKGEREKAIADHIAAEVYAGRRAEIEDARGVADMNTARLAKARNMSGRAEASTYLDGQSTDALNAMQKELGLSGGRSRAQKRDQILGALYPSEPAPGKKTKDPFNPADVAAKIDAIDVGGPGDDREKGRELIKGLKIDELRQLAKTMGVTVTGRTKPAIQNDILHQTVGRRSDSAAIERSFDRGGNAFEPPAARGEMPPDVKAMLFGDPTRVVEEVAQARRDRARAAGKPFLGIRPGETSEQARERFRREFDASPAGQRQRALEEARPRIEATVAKIAGSADRVAIEQAIRGEKFTAPMVKELADNMGIEFPRGMPAADRPRFIADELHRVNRRHVGRRPPELPTEIDGTFVPRRWHWLLGGMGRDPLEPALTTGADDELRQMEGAGLVEKLGRPGASGRQMWDLTDKGRRIAKVVRDAEDAADADMNQRMEQHRRDVAAEDARVAAARGAQDAAPRGRRSRRLADVPNNVTNLPTSRPRRGAPRSEFDGKPLDELIAGLQEMEDTEAVRDALVSRSDDEILAIARAIPTVQSNNADRLEMVDSIVEGTAGFKERARLGSHAGPAVAPRTALASARSFGRGDMIELEGQAWRVVGNRMHNDGPVTRDGGGWRVTLQLEDPATGELEEITLPANGMQRRLPGSGGGSGSFSVLDLDALLYPGHQTAAGKLYSFDDLEDGAEFNLTGQALDAFNDKHPRGAGGRFGRKSGLGQKLAAKVGHSGRRGRVDAGEDDEPDGMEWEDDEDGFGRYIQWDSKDSLGNIMLDVGGGRRQPDDTVDEDDEGNPLDEDGNPLEWESQDARLVMSRDDMRKFVGALATARMKDRFLTDPDRYDPEDRTLLQQLLYATMDKHGGITGTEIKRFDEETEEQEISIRPQREKAYGADGGDKTPTDEWAIQFTDDDGGSADLLLTGKELDQLHAQLTRQLIDWDEEEHPYNYAPRTNQTASMAEFDVSRMPPQLIEHWVHGPGAAEVMWCTRGGWRRGRRALKREGVPRHMLDGATTNLYVMACGHGPGKKDHKALAVMAELEAAAAVFGDLTPAAPAFRSQIACACGDHEYQTQLEQPSTSKGWRGPLAPINVSTGDRREFAEGALGTRMLPLPLRWQEHQDRGHDGAVVVGALTGYSIAEDGTIRSEGYFLDPKIVPDVLKAMHLVEHQLVGPSVDLEPDMDVRYVNPDNGEEYSPHQCAMDGSCPPKGKSVITRGTIAGATLVPITAFAEVRAPELFDRTVADDARVMNYGATCPSGGCVNQIAAVARVSRFDDMPIAGRGYSWSKADAIGRLAQWAGLNEGGQDASEWDRYAQAFLWRDGAATDKTGFKFPIADIIDGRLTIVPQAVFNAAARIDSALIPSMAKTQLRDVIEDLYGQIGEDLGDPDLQAPWERDHEMSAGAAPDCGCDGKFAPSSLKEDDRADQLAADQTAAATYGVFGDMEPYPADAFAHELDALTPITIEQREGEPFARIYGHAASWSSCNRGYRGMCVPAPKSRSNYAQFHLGAARTDQGLLPVGKIVMGEGHPDVGNGVRIARAFYDSTSKTVAIVRAHDDRFGLRLSGVLVPDVTPQEATMLLASPPSGDWKDHELIAVLAVNVPGHVVPRAAEIGGQPRNMVAAGRFWTEEQQQLEDLELQMIAAMFAASERRELATLAASFT